MMTCDTCDVWFVIGTGGFMIYAVGLDNDELNCGGNEFYANELVIFPRMMVSSIKRKL